MTHPVVSQVPEWVNASLQIGTFVSVSIASVLVGIRRIGKSETNTQATVLAGTIASTRDFNLIVDAVDSLKAEMRESRDDEHSRTRRTNEAIESLVRALNANTEALGRRR